jgi:hypothetical protein
MKTLTTIVILTLTTVVYGQDNYQVEPDSLSIVKLEFEILDSAAIKMTNPLVNIHFPNIISYHSQEGIKLAYYTTDKNRWTSFLLPFSEQTNDFDLVNLDKKGHSELIVKGDVLTYGSGGGTGIKGMLIINIDSIPTQIFKIYYSCWEESFGDKNNNGAGAYINSYTRQIKITETTIIIAPLDKKKYPAETDCSLTNIPNGIYIMDSGRIRKKK